MATARFTITPKFNPIIKDLMEELHHPVDEVLRLFL
jgi:hypothetical protein